MLKALNSGNLFMFAAMKGRQRIMVFVVASRALDCSFCFNFGVCNYIF